jgi:DNA helicase-2/ATP-dependent DNA helicase PcrA
LLDAAGLPNPDANFRYGLSAWKVEGRQVPPDARPALEAYAALLTARGAIDFDDMVVRAADLLETDAVLRGQWQARFEHVCVDEFQDVDAAQLRLVRLLAAPEDNLFVVGDDDQTIYAWRLADVRRILGFSDLYPTARRVMLATNYRCPRAVVDASARLVATNRERFTKPIRAPASLRPEAGSISAVDSTAPDWLPSVASLAARESAASRTLCFLARTRGELTPILLALVRAGVRHTMATAPLVESDRVVKLIDAARASPDRAHPFHALQRLRRTRGWDRGSPAGDLLADEDHDALDALVSWTAGFATTEAFVAAFDAARARIASLRDPDAAVELATVHASKGREWETVVLLGFEADRIPNRRSLLDATEPERAREEERRLAYVALTRATRRLILAVNSLRPSPFLAEMGFVASDGPQDAAAAASRRRRRGGRSASGEASVSPRTDLR